MGALKEARLPGQLFDRRVRQLLHFRGPPLLWGRLPTPLLHQGREHDPADVQVEACTACTGNKEDVVVA